MNFQLWSLGLCAQRLLNTSSGYAIVYDTQHLQIKFMVSVLSPSAGFASLNGWCHNPLGITGQKPGFLSLEITVAIHLSIQLKHFLNKLIFSFLALLPSLSPLPSLTPLFFKYLLGFVCGRQCDKYLGSDEKGWARLFWGAYNLRGKTHTKINN